MRTTRARTLAVATVAAGLLAGGITAGATDVLPGDKPTDTIANAAAGQPKNPSQAQGENAAAAAAQTRTNSADKPVYLIHGYDPSIKSTGCNKWNKTARAMKSWGWTGKFVKVGFYAVDEGSKCTVNIAREGDADTPIKELGKKLAWDVYNRYTVKGKTVDMVGHSMGGLIARAALTGTARQERGFPPKLYVEDVVTLGTPHRGAASSYLCTEGQQCADMRATSDFMSWLGVTVPQADQGTDWTLIASHADHVAPVSTASPDLSGAQHLVRYAASTGLIHSKLRTTTNDTFRMNHSNNGSAWQHIRYGAAPIRATMNALYSASKW
ncbi:esterase/lipase family protein [Streptomyces sp. NPDC059943]|uniref:esterase/lipase family protein n=1 Tax=Streptomyces sp. NPDC059943 TaxID=3347010 RepID=UPI003665E10A